MGPGYSDGENQRKGEEIDIFPSLAPSKVLKRIQGEDKNFSSLAEIKEEVKRHGVQQGKERMSDCFK